MEEDNRGPTSQSQIHHRPSFSDNPIAATVNIPQDLLLGQTRDEKPGFMDQPGFLDMLGGGHDFNSSSSIFDDLFQNISVGPLMIDSMTAVEPPEVPAAAAAEPESSGAGTTPVMTNSPCSMSSSSTEGKRKNEAVEDEEEEEDEGPDKEKSNKHLKPKKKKQKREREPRFAFMTKSDIDNLDDGYRWRKYGQKAVKNSPFPRSYYRCTSAACGVKKRVERSSEDASVVVTTYEGTHTHPCPITPRGAFGFLPETATATTGSSSMSRFAMPPIQYHHRSPNDIVQHPYFRNLTPPLSLAPNYGTNYPAVFSPLFAEESRLRPSPGNVASSSSLERDRGLLQDMLPSQMLKGPKED